MLAPEEILESKWRFRFVFGTISYYFSSFDPVAHSQPCQTPKIERLAVFQSLSNSATVSTRFL